MIESIYHSDTNMTIKRYDQDSPASYINGWPFDQCPFFTGLQTNNMVNNNRRRRQQRLALAAMWLARMRRRRQRERRVWVKTWLQRRAAQGVHNNLARELEMDEPDMFRQYFRLTPEGFQIVLEKIEHMIVREDTVMRKSITPSERLAVTLRFLATGMYRISVKI